MYIYTYKYTQSIPYPIFTICLGQVVFAAMWGICNLEKIDGSGTEVLRRGRGMDAWREGGG